MIFKYVDLCRTKTGSTLPFTIENNHAARFLESENQDI